MENIGPKIENKGTFIIINTQWVRLSIFKTCCVFFRNKNFKSEDFENEDFENKDFENKDFENEDFENEDFKNEDFENQDFKNKDFEILINNSKSMY